MSSQGERSLLAAFELALLSVLAIGIAVGELYPVITSLVFMAVIALPWALQRRGIAHLPWPVTLAAGSVLLLHSLGILFQFYDLLWWWDTMTHMMATLIIALVASLVLVSMDRLLPDVRVPLRLVPAVTLASVVVLGVIWEVLEFAFDGALGINMQYSLDDTATDLTFDILGGGLVALAIVPLLGLMKEASLEMFRGRAP